jgi:hypothetical protein
LAEGECNEKEGQVLQQSLENCLLESHHYRLARELGQLHMSKIIVRPNAMGHYYDLCIKSGKVAGNIKPEPLIEV